MKRAIDTTEERRTIQEFNITQTWDNSRKESAKRWPILWKAPLNLGKAQGAAMLGFGREVAEAGE